MCRDLGPAQHQGGRLQPPLLLLSHGGLQLLPAGPSSRPSPHHQHMLKTWGNQHSFSLKNRSGALLLRSYGPIIPVFLKHVFFFFLRCPKAGVSEILFKDFKILRMHLLFFFLATPMGRQKFPGQGSNPSDSSDHAKSFTATSHQGSPGCPFHFYSVSHRARPPRHGDKG